MKLTSTIARILLGVLFLVSGLNGFLQFIKTASHHRSCRAVHGGSLRLP
jgi:uncharacterized membrane protein YphA (DoxX/SURF4 family)